MARQAAIHPVHAVFVMVSGEDDPGRHLRILAQLAGRVEDESFLPEWLSGGDEQDLKETLLRDDRFHRFLSIRLDPETPVNAWIGKSLQELDLPDGLLVVLIRRRGRSIVPQWRTVLRSGDRLTILGEPGGLAELSDRLGGKAA